MNYDEKRKTRIKRTATALAIILAATSLTGCEEPAIQEDLDTINIGDTNEEGFSTLRKVSDVPGETFKLVSEFAADSNSQRSWKITANKFLYIKMYTQGLDPNTKVFIDNIHIDTSIISDYAAMDGITQDTMDDRIHNSLMYGFPIGNDIEYYGINSIEGLNEGFIKLTAYGVEGLKNLMFIEGGTKRYTENYLKDKLKVTGNKIQTVVDLLVQNGDEVPRNVSVPIDFKVELPKELTR